MKVNQLVYEINDINLENDELMLYETLFHNANGYIGIRSCFEEGYEKGYNTIRGTYINGFYDIVEMKQAEKLYGLIEEKQAMLNIADTQSIELKIDNESFSLFEGTTLRVRRFLDMEHGITGREVLWRSPSGKEVEIIIKRMTSFYQLSLFTIEYSIKAVNFDGKVELLSYHIGDVMNYSNPDDPRVANESLKHIIPVDVDCVNGASYIISNTLVSGLSVCTGVKHILSKECLEKMDLLVNTVTSSYTFDIAHNETVTLTKYSIFSDSIRHKDCKENAKAEMTKALEKTLTEHYSHQADYLKEYWKNTYLEIDGDEELSLAVRYNMYQLIQSVGKDEHSNIAAKGLSGEGYEGHYFWDTEMYIQPFFTLTEPGIAKNLIKYRYTTLEKARENAKLLGHKKGALYPWRTIMGSECSGYFPSGTAAYHINGDIAYSIITYYLATKDIDFIADYGAEIIFETARLWMDVGNFYNGQFRINEVTGPDEYTCMVNNNYYTNACAQFNLKWAVKFYDLLTESKKISHVVDKMNLSEIEIKDFEKASGCMYLPYDETLKINPQDDSFLEKKVWDFEHTPKEDYPLLLHYHPLCLYRHQVCKQADTVLAHFIFEDAQSLETIRNSFNYYEKVTTHDSSLSTCIFSIVASKLGLTHKAYDYFGDSAKLDLFNTHKNTKDGIHTANMGGNYMAIVYGFAGLRLKEDGLHFAPNLPLQWDGYRFKVNYEDSMIMVEVFKNKCIFTLISGTGKTFFVREKEYRLESSLIISQ
ncbi:MAG: treP [Anaerocolumna sp.]|jgi:alpha,alpha-trehalose phosphorylase|nr:treP [Anaerocolumna sp.]